MGAKVSSATQPAAPQNRRWRWLPPTGATGRPPSSIREGGSVPSNSSTMPCASLTACVNRTSHRPCSSPVALNSSAGKRSQDAAGNVQIRIGAGSGFGRHRERHPQRGQRQPPDWSPADLLLLPQIGGKLARAVRIESQLAHRIVLAQVAQQQVGPGIGPAAQAVQLDRFGRGDVRAMDRQQRQGPLPHVQMPQEHAAGDRLGFVGLASPIVGIEHGRPGREARYLGQQNFFQHRMDLGRQAGGILGRLMLQGRESFERASQRSSRHLDAAQYWCKADEEIRPGPSTNTGPCTATRAATSINSRQCMRLERGVKRWSETNASPPEGRESRGAAAEPGEPEGTKALPAGKCRAPSRWPAEGKQSRCQEGPAIAGRDAANRLNSRRGNRLTRESAGDRRLQHGGQNATPGRLRRLPKNNPARSHYP